LQNVKPAGKQKQVKAKAKAKRLRLRLRLRFRSADANKPVLLYKKFRQYNSNNKSCDNCDNYFPIFIPEGFKPTLIRFIHQLL
jgi:hypothetical protein